MSDKSQPSQKERERSAEPKKRKWSLSRFTLLGLLTGVVAGLFFGDYCAPLQIVGKAFIGLLQMTVYPYIAVSIIANIGKLTQGQATRLARQGLYILCLLWGIGLLMLVVMPLSFPNWSTAAFFSKSRLEDPPGINFFDLFIPSNPFAAFANGWVPAIVVFCVCVGIALIRLENKKPLFEQLDILAQALGQVNHFIIQLMPFGIFAIAASAAGTLSIAEFSRLQAYLLTYTLAVLFLSFWVLPMLIVTLTPFSYREVLSASRDALITGFVTGKLIIVLPLLIEGTKKLFERHAPQREELQSEVALLYPLIYPFPNLGKVLTALFIPFSAWFLGEPIPPEQYPAFLGASLFNMFANVIVGIESLLNMMHLPSDMLHLFVIGGVYSSRVGEILGVMHLITFVVIATAGAAGLLRFQLKRFMAYLGITFLLLVGVIEGARLFLGQSVKDSYTKDKVLQNMQLLEKQAEAEVLRETNPNPTPLRPGQSYMSRIRERGVIRVGYGPDDLPYSYFNAKGDLVGFDVEMAHRLASDLGVKLELIPIDHKKLPQQMERDCFDIVMSGLPATLKRAEQFLLSDPYLAVTVALVVPDHRLNQFQNPDWLKRAKGLRIAHTEALGQRFRGRISAVLSEPELIQITTYEEYFFTGKSKYDALLIDAESGAAWTVLYPHFKVAVLPNLRIRFPLVYPIGGRDGELQKVINNWIRLGEEDGTIEKVYDHWILGKIPNNHARRWCIIRDVLHWAD